ncbi:MAG: redoxin domain-containing protein [Pseudomonadota bacterium]
MIHPGRRFPSIRLHMLDGTAFELPADVDSAFTLLIVYRGVQCSICQTYLREATARLSDFSELDTRILVTSAESAERAGRAQSEWTNDRILFGYGLDAGSGRQLRLFRSSARKDTEPDEFFEPALFLLNADGELLFASIQSMPFGRPSIGELLRWIERIRDNAIPARGTVEY